MYQFCLCFHVLSKSHFLCLKGSRVSNIFALNLHRPFPFLHFLLSFRWRTWGHIYCWQEKLCLMKINQAKDSRRRIAQHRNYVHLLSVHFSIKQMKHWCQQLEYRKERDQELFVWRDCISPGNNTLLILLTHRVKRKCNLNKWEQVYITQWPTTMVLIS